MQLETQSGLDARLIVFLNYQSLFLLFSRHSIDIYNSKLQRIHSYVQIKSYHHHSSLLHVDSPKIPSMQTIRMTILHMSPPTKICWFVTTATAFALEKSRYMISLLENGTFHVIVEVKIHQTIMLWKTSAASLMTLKEIFYTLVGTCLSIALIVGTRAGLLHVWSIPRSID